MVAALARQALGDRAACVAGGVVALADAAEQEDLVVHRQPEHDRQQQRRGHRVHVAQRLEAGEAVQPAPLEDGHQHAVGGAHREQVHQHRLQRQQHRAQQHQQDQVAEGQHEQQDLPHRSADQVLEVLDGRRGAADADAGVAHLDRSQPVDHRPGLRALRIVARLDREQGGAAVAGELGAAHGGGLRVTPGLRRDPGQRAAVGGVHQHLGRPGGPGPGLARGQLGALAGLVALRELAQGAVARLQRQRRDGQHQHHGRAGRGEQQRPAHDGVGPALPEAGALVGGIGGARAGAGASAAARPSRPITVAVRPRL